MQNNSAFEIQNQIKQSVIINQEAIKELKKWEKEQKEQEFQKQKENLQSSSEDKVSFWFLWYFNYNFSWDIILFILLP